MLEHFIFCFKILSLFTREVFIKSVIFEFKNLKRHVHKFKLKRYIFKIVKALYFNRRTCFIYVFILNQAF